MKEDPTFPRAELQRSPTGQAYPGEEGCSLAVICQRMRWEAQLLSAEVQSRDRSIKHRRMRWHRSGGTTSRGHQEDALQRLYRGCHTSTGVILVHHGSIVTV